MTCARRWSTSWASPANSRNCAAISSAELPPSGIRAAPIPDKSGELARTRRRDKRLSADFTEALGFIKSSIAKMDRLISAILNLTREGRREFQPVQIDTRELIEGIVATVAHQAAEAEAQIHVEPLPAIVSDRLSLEQIFSNLCGDEKCLFAGFLAGRKP